MVQKTERLYLNVVKGLAVFLMIWGHCIQYCAGDSLPVYDNAVFQMIYSFHMPLFMLISGYLFYFSYEKRDLQDLLVHRTQGMLQPIVFGSILNMLLIILPTWILHRTARLFNGALFNGLYSLWFLWCVLSSGTAVALAARKSKSFLQRAYFLILGFFFVALFPENYYHIYMYPYFVAGFLYGMYCRQIPAWVKKLAILSVPAYLILIPVYDIKHFIYVTPVFSQDIEKVELLRINGFRWVIGFVGSLAVLKLTDLKLRKTYERGSGSAIVSGLEKLGENSLAIYVISVSLLSYYLPKIYDRIILMTGTVLFADNVLLYNFVFTPMLSVCYCFALYYIVQLMKRIKIHRLIFGR